MCALARVRPGRTTEMLHRRRTGARPERPCSKDAPGMANMELKWLSIYNHQTFQDFQAVNLDCVHIVFVVAQFHCTL